MLYQACDKKLFKSVSILSVLEISKKALSTTDLQKLLKDDLIIIDNLWKQYSNNKFGILVQVNIYKEQKEDYYDFCNSVGWRRNGRWVGYNDLNWSLNSFSGHLPWLQGRKIFLTEESMGNINFNSQALDLGDIFFSSIVLVRSKAYPTIISATLRISSEIATSNK